MKLSPDLWHWEINFYKKYDVAVPDTGMERTGDLPDNKKPSR
jgi:hypothetical protein